MTKLSGFPEFLPAERNVGLVVLDHLRSVFGLHGFASIETRAVEPMDTLLRKGEIDKEVYTIRRLHAADGDGGGDRGDVLALHFDLTVPFARYVVENAGKLDFPFRRYQIQKVWRGERPQQGRFREFVQADIDIVAKDELPIHFDVEIAQVMAEALAGLPVPPLTLQVSNRKILEGFYLGLGITEPTAVMPIVDKLDKVPADKIALLLQSDAGLTAAQAASCLALAGISAADDSFVAAVRALGVTHPLLDEGLEELRRVVVGAAGADGVEVVADLRIARGLDYYTGTVFETRMARYEHLGSICSGGRYDQLASDGKATYPGVGISLGVSRLLVPLIADGLTADRSVPSAVLVALIDEDTRPASVAVAVALRARGIPTEVAASAQKYGKQIRNAERRGIPFVWFPAPLDSEDEHQVKDIRSGDQADADPATWAPAATDLKPRILTPPAKEQNT
ncbi:histidine--tRNA ligase [Aeromicrobium sp.]|uniref:histidine--tRNA ligase n=1 Tax=Aeromicrobium sp. TaxID=1871063 RepID=UPI0019C5DC2E|nr:histidine--tRNA ligase [Aeromicrobium sp.]MBC7633164.1 histidine--tRNA ligase [Aeromicrobium sp.]